MAARVTQPPEKTPPTKLMRNTNLSKAALHRKPACHGHMCLLHTHHVHPQLLPNHCQLRDLALKTPYIMAQEAQHNVRWGEKQNGTDREAGGAALDVQPRTHPRLTSILLTEEVLDSGRVHSSNTAALAGGVRHRPCHPRGRLAPHSRAGAIGRRHPTEQNPLPNPTRCQAPTCCRRSCVGGGRGRGRRGGHGSYGRAGDAPTFTRGQRH